MQEQYMVPSARHSCIPQKCCCSATLFSCENLLRELDLLYWHLYDLDRIYCVLLELQTQSDEEPELMFQNIRLSRALIFPPWKYSFEQLAMHILDFFFLNLPLKHNLLSTSGGRILDWRV